MSDIEKTLISLPALAVAVVLLLAINANPDIMGGLLSDKVNSSATVHGLQSSEEFNLAPYQRPPHFPD